MIKDYNENVISIDNTNANIKENSLVVRGDRLPFSQKLSPHGDTRVFLIGVKK